MASRIILARLSRTRAASAVSPLVSARPQPWLCGGSDLLLSSSPIKMPVNQFSSFSFSAELNGNLKDGKFQSFKFSSSASPQSNSSAENGKVKESSAENAKGSPEKESTKAEEALDSDNEAELSKEELMKLLVEKDELLEEKQKEFETMKDKLIRGYAEMENVMNRTKREAENSKKFAIQSFAKSLLDVADNLERASSVVKESFAKINENEADKAAPLLKTLLEGVEMTEKQLSEVYRKFGVQKYDAENETFDPHRHMAVFEVPDASKPPGTVAIVLKKGYMLHDRVLRPAEVGVTKSPEQSLE